MISLWSSSLWGGSSRGPHNQSVRRIRSAARLRCSGVHPRTTRAGFQGDFVHLETLKLFGPLKNFAYYLVCLIALIFFSGNRTRDSRQSCPRAREAMITLPSPREKAECSLPAWVRRLYLTPPFSKSESIPDSSAISGPPKRYWITSERLT
jgi:hypothetical protein